MWTANRVSRSDSIHSITKSMSFSSPRPSPLEDSSVNQKIAMWSTVTQGETLVGDVPSRLSRSPSSHSIQSSASSRGSTLGDGLDKSPPPQYEFWQPNTKIEPTVLEIPLQRRESISSQHSRSTLAEELTEHEMDLKTPTVTRKIIEPEIDEIEELEETGKIEESEGPEAPSVVEEPLAPAGPLEQQLLMLLSKVKMVERDQPTVMAEDYKRIEDRVQALEAEKQAWQKRQEALFSLRDEDIANLIKVRGLLAAERREHAAMCKLRDDDLQNVLELRGKLANITWNKAKLSPEKSEVSRGSRVSMREGSDLWQAAKTAALEQRLLELEHANAELKAQLDSNVSSSATTHPASIGSGNIGKMEAFLEETLRHREKNATKVQQLRSENESLRKEMGRLEDRNSQLEDTVLRLQRWA